MTYILIKVLDKRLVYHILSLTFILTIIYFNINIYIVDFTRKKVEKLMVTGFKMSRGI